jgi:uncharacterized membrane protein YphA (DoxX/SURF4 family)
MNVVLWIIAIVLAAAFLASGLLKVTQSKEQLAARGLGWVEDFDPPQITGIGALEILAAIGLVLPAAVDIAPILVPVAACGLAVIMIGAMVTHARRKEYQLLPVNAVFLVLAAVVAWGRFGPHSF